MVKTRPAKASPVKKAFTPPNKSPNWPRVCISPTGSNDKNEITCRANTTPMPIYSHLRGGSLSNQPPILLHLFPQDGYDTPPSLVPMAAYTLSGERHLTQMSDI